MAELRADDLGFTIEEASSYLKNMVGVLISEQDIAILENRTEGWVAGLKMKLVGIFGYATPSIANTLVTRGGVLIVPPEGFFVKGRGGPLKEDEPERADRWAKATVAAYYNRLPA